MLSRQCLSVKDVADLLKVGDVAVRSWIKHGDLRAVEVGREWRIAPLDRGVDVEIEALGRQQTFEAALRVLRLGAPSRPLAGHLCPK